MAKKGQKTKVCTLAACVCSRCGQRANAQPGTGHFFCSGMSAEYLANLHPSMRGKITNPKRKGSWVVVTVEQAISA